jgi:predicted kinase
MNDAHPSPYRQAFLSHRDPNRTRLSTKLVLLCGIPGSGKTTIGNATTTRMTHSIFVQTDRIRSMLTRPKYTGPESRFVYSALTVIGAEALKAGYDVFLEGTFPREEFRSEVTAALSHLAARILIVYVFCDPELAFGRNAGRKEAVPWESFSRIFTRFEEPQDALKIDSGHVSPDEAAKLIESALK